MVGLTIRHLPGKGGHSPADGFEAGGFPSPIELPGIAIAALASLSLGVVLGPEAPLIALGAGLAGWAVRLARRPVPAQATAVAAVVGTGIRRLALELRPHVERRLLLVTPLVGLAVGVLAVIYAEASGDSFSDVLFSGQDALGPLIANSDDYSVAALLLLVACKGLAYSASLAGFRGGPVFPAMFLGAAGGVAMSHLPGLPLVPGVAMGIGAMCVVMLRLPLTSVLLATLLLLSDGLAVMPLVIVAVAVAYAASARLTPSACRDPGSRASGRGASPSIPNACAANGSQSARALERRPWSRGGARPGSADDA